jgi:hypothetical protein
MKDIQKIKEFFSKPMKEGNEEDGYEVVWSDRDYKEYSKFFKNDPQGAPENAKKKALAFMKSLEDKDKKSTYGLYRSINLKEGNEEYFKPVVRKDKSNPNFLYVDIAYPEGSGVLSVGGSKTMSGQDRESGASKALSMGNAIVKKLQSKYNIEDIEVKDLKNGKVQVFAVSDDFTKMSSPSLDEAQEGESLYKDWDQFEKPSKIQVYLNNGKTLEISPLKLKGGKRVYDAILQAFIDDRFDITNKVIQGMMNNLSEAKKEDAVDTITMDVPLFIRMLEYSREDAAEDMDLHDVTEKAISLGKERGILQMDDYDEIIGTTEKVNEGIEKRISEALDKINEELCPAGKAYRKRRIAAGEKSSAYLSGRAVKVCKGQISGKKKKK